MNLKVKGTILLARKDYVVDQHGASVWDAVIEALQPADTEILGGLILPSGWYDFALNDRLDQAIVKTVGRDRTQIFKDLGAWSAKRNLRGPHKAFLSPGNPGKFMENTSRIYSYYYDVGHRSYEATGETSGVFTTFDAETYSKTDCLTVIGWYEEALRMCGANNVRIVEDTCRARNGQFCRYQVKWEI